MSEDLSVQYCEYHGSANIILEDPGTLHEDRTGLSTCTATWVTRRQNWGAFPTINTAHPIFAYIGIESRSISFQGAFARCECNYAGIATDETEPVYELVVGLSEERIDTHPDFVTKIGGTPMIPQNGAVFRKVGGPLDGKKYDQYSSPMPTDNKGYIFDSFHLLLESGALNPYAGCENYLNACAMTWKKSWNKKVTVSSISSVGRIDNPMGNPPNLPSGANWLNMGVTQTKRGICYASTQEWRASGRRGWLSDVY